MNLYTCTNFEGFYPVGSAAVVVAEDRQQAAKLLEAELERQGLPQQLGIRERDIEELSLTEAKAYVLVDGNY